MTSFNNSNNNSAGNNNGSKNALYARRSLRVIDPESDVSFLFVPPSASCPIINVYYILSSKLTPGSVFSRLPNCHLSSNINLHPTSSSLAFILRSPVCLFSFSRMFFTLLRI